MLFFVFFFLFAWAEEDWTNPYKEYDQATMLLVKNIHYSTQSAGTVQKPGVVGVEFALKDSKEERKDLKYFLTCPKTPVEAKVSMRYEEGRYLGSIVMPKMDWTATCYFNILSTRGMGHYQSNVPLRYEKERFNLVFLIDNSGSMMNNDRGNKRYEAIRKVITRYGSMANKIGVLGFSDDVTVFWDLQKVNDLDKIRAALSKPFSSGGTDISVSMTYLERYLKEKSKGVSTKVFFLTDGLPSTDYHEEHLKIGALGIPIYTIRFGADQGGKNEAFLKKIALETHGAYYEASRQNIETVFKNIFKEEVFPDEKEWMMKSLFGENEIIFVEVYDPSSRVSLDLGKTPVLSLGKEDGALRFGFYPLPVGRYEGKVIIQKGTSLVRHGVSFEVVKQKQVFALKGDFRDTYALSQKRHRFPFLIENLRSEADDYRLSLITPEEKDSRYFLETSFIHLGVGEKRVFSMGIREEKPSDEQESVYLVVENHQGAFMYDISVDNVLRYSSVERSDTPKKSWIGWVSLLFFWGLTGLASYHTMRGHRVFWRK